MSKQIQLQLNYMQAILRSEDKTSAEKLSELLPLRELISGEVLGDLDEVGNFVENNWHYLTKILFYVRIHDIDGFQQELLELLIKYTPKDAIKDSSSEIPITA